MYRLDGYVLKICMVVYTFLHGSICARMVSCVCIYVYDHIYAYAHMCLWIYICIYVHSYAHVCISYTYTCTQIPTHESNLCEN